MRPIEFHSIGPTREESPQEENYESMGTKVGKETHLSTLRLLMAYLQIKKNYQSYLDIHRIYFIASCMTYL